MSVFREVVDDMVTADTVLAQIALVESESTPAIESVNSLRVPHELAKARMYYNRALCFTGNHNTHAISDFSQAWRYAMNAMRIANLDY